MMKLNRQSVLLAVLGLIAVVHFGDWILNTLIQQPLNERRSRVNQLNKDIKKFETQLAETRKLSKDTERWVQQSLPADPEVARSAYRHWLISLVRDVRLRNAVVDSGSPSARRTRNGGILFRSLPFSVRARGTLAQFNSLLFRFHQAGHLHQLTAFTLTPMNASGQFDMSLSIETLLLPARKGSALNEGHSALPAFDTLDAYSTIVSDNVFGIGIDQSDPMDHTKVSAITFSNGVPMVWFTEELADKTIQVPLNGEFDTVALSGKVLEARDFEVVIESGGERLLLPIGQPFSKAVPLPQETQAAAPAATP